MEIISKKRSRRSFLKLPIFLGVPSLAIVSQVSKFNFFKKTEHIDRHRVIRDLLLSNLMDAHFASIDESVNYFIENF